MPRQARPRSSRSKRKAEPAASKVVERHIRDPYGTLQAAPSKEGEEGGALCSKCCLIVTRRFRRTPSLRVGLEEE